VRNASAAGRVAGRECVPVPKAIGEDGANFTYGHPERNAPETPLETGKFIELKKNNMRK
jgi:hypothetical protein